MRRRQFISLVGGAAAWPVAARGQQPAMPLIGLLGLTSPEAFARELAAFKQGLVEAGYVEGGNATIEYRWARGQFDRLPPLATELVRHGAIVIAAIGTPASALAAKAATSTIPVVFVTGGDPVQMGLVASLNRPGGNATGVYMLTSALEPKRLELLRELVPNAEVIGVLVDPNSPDTEIQLRDLPVAAQSLGQQIRFLRAGNEGDIDAAFATLIKQKIGALVVASSPSYLPLREQIVTLAARHAVPTVYFLRDFATVGGLMSYGTSLVDAYRRAGIYTGRILKGERAADLPVEQSTRVELVINMKTAKDLGLTFPITLLGRADEVIE
jgi:putative tryptophan/tyrosine transport system substrate-binding protein